MEWEWQPIETAPKERGLILLWRPTTHWKVDLGCWRPNTIKAAHWGSWNAMPIYWCIQNPPTHWMPLPEPPDA